MSARSRLATARLILERHFLAGRQAGRHSGRLKDGGRVLCYHAVGAAPPAWGRSNILSPERFRAQMLQALHLGFHFVPAERIARGGGGPRDLAVTFDDGLPSVVSGAEPVLSELGIPWTLFVVTDWADGKHSFGPDASFLNWQDLDVLHARGVSIGSHSKSHPNFARIGGREALDELVLSRGIIAERLGIQCTEFAIPFGQSHDWSAGAQMTAETAGYTTIYAQSEQPAPPGTTPRTFITRFDDERLFRAALWGAFDNWEEWF